jgi:N-dimethylarginine dimethylaminohydrolase
MTTGALLPTPAVTAQRRGGGRVATRRRYVLCPPTYFDVVYAINPWMHPGTVVDHERALAQWQTLVDTYVSLGHEVHIVPPVAGLPDMVFAANGGIAVDGRAISSRYRFPQRTGEERPFHDALLALGIDVHRPEYVLEGEGDVLVAGRHVLVGSGFRSDPRAAADIGRRLAVPAGREVVALELVDERYYHLDVALAVLDETAAAYLPEAFSAESIARLHRVFDDLIPCTLEDAAVLGLNVVSDGLHVVMEQAATGLAEALQHKGFRPIGVDMGELRLSGGAVKCCTLELHA